MFDLGTKQELVKRLKEVLNPVHFHFNGHGCKVFEEDEYILQFGGGCFYLLWV